MLQPTDSGGLGQDTYGTHADGFRALYEMLEELRVPVAAANRSAETRR